MNAMEYTMMLIVVLVCVLGFTTFGTDIAVHYDTTMPENLTNAAEGVIGSMNDTRTTFYEIITNEGGWLQTTFNVFFTLPSSLITTLLSLPGMGNELMVVGLQEAGIAGDVPDWFFAIVAIAMAFIIIWVIVSVITNRGTT